MRKIIVGIIVIMFMGCSLGNEIMDSYYELKIDKMDLYYNDDFTEDPMDFILENINPKSEMVDIFSAPKETAERGYGDCEDFALLYINILYVVKGEKSNMILVNNRSVVNGGIVSHVVVELTDGTQIEPQTGDPVNYSIGFRYKFDSIFN